MKKIMATIVCICVIAIGTRAQDARSRAINELTKLTGRYQSEGSLSFDVTYNYSLQSDPAKIVETMKGKCLMKGRKCDYTIDKTRTVFDGTMLAAIYDEDSLIYLSRPAIASVNINPVKMLDSVFNTTDVKYSVEEKAGQLTITLDFLKDASCKKIIYVIDRKSGLLSRMVQVVSSKLMYEQAEAAPAGANETYSIVETLFSRYSTDGLNDQQFDVTRYVKKEGEQFVAVGDYRTYKIFVATPNL